MAAETRGDAKLPLDTFTQSTPPGWRPGLRWYPLMRYRQLLALWYRQTSLGETQLGPAMAGRLRGTAFQFALALTAQRLDLDTGNRRQMIGDELLAQPGHADWTNPATGEVHAEEKMVVEC